VELVRWPHRTDTALVTDFDGTLAPIVDDPARATALGAALHALGVLVDELGLVGVISGRPVDFLRERLPLPGVELVGQYGLERLVEGRVLVDERAAPYRTAVRAAADEAEVTWPDLLVERKGELAVTVHWRTAPDRAPTPSALQALASRHGLATQVGRRACELRPPLPVDKGTALVALLERAGTPSRVAFAGDDRGDLAAFEAVGPGPGGVRIAVRSPESPPELLELADVVVDGPEGLAALLGELATGAAERPRAG
jgi:trehalose 6-phosphate phosphatase